MQKLSLHTSKVHFSLLIGVQCLDSLGFPQHNLESFSPPLASVCSSERLLSMLTLLIFSTILFSASDSFSRGGGRSRLLSLPLSRTWTNAGNTFACGPADPDRQAGGYREDPAVRTVTSAYSAVKRRHFLGAFSHAHAHAHTKHTHTECRRFNRKL